MVAIAVGVWRVSATPDGMDAYDAVQGARGDAETAAQALGHVSNMVAFVGIGAFHLQLSAIKLNMPSFPFPPALRAIARWLDSVIGFDLGDLASPECQDPTMRAYDSLATKTMLINGAFVVVVVGLWCAGKRLGRRNHARNAMLAAYTLMLTVCAKAHARWLDCTDGMFDAAPGEACDFRGPLLASPILLYVAVVPLLIVLSLRRDSKPLCKCCHSAERNEAFNYNASYGWVTRKYAPSYRWFELAFLAYKVAAVFASGECHSIVLCRIICRRSCPPWNEMDPRMH